jgi:integrase/recombinase XerD
MVSDPTGGIGTVLELPAVSAKMGSGRRIPLHPELRRSLASLKAETKAKAESGPIVVSERGGRMTAKSIVNWFLRFYHKAGMLGCSSHSGRRTFVTRGAQLVFRTGGSLRDVQELAGHRSIKTTQAYIEGNRDAQRHQVKPLSLMKP